MQQERRRSRLILRVLSLGLLAGMVLTAPPAQAVDAVGPYYAVPSWDRKIAPANRFVVLTNWNSEAVLDKETGLVWERSPATTTIVWHQATFNCLTRSCPGRANPRFGNSAPSGSPSNLPTPCSSTGAPNACPARNHSTCVRYSI